MDGAVPSLPPYVPKSIINYVEGDLCLNGLHATATRLGIRHPANVNKIKQQWCSEVSKQETLYTIQGEHKVLPWLQTFITNIHLDMLELYVAPQLEEFQPWIIFPTRWCTSTLGFTCSLVFGCNISKQVDWERWSDTLAITIAGYHPPWLLFTGVCFRHQFQILQIWRQE